MKIINILKPLFGTNIYNMNQLITQQKNMIKDSKDKYKQPSFSHRQYGQHGIHSPYAGNPPFYDTHFGIHHAQHQNPDYDLEAALAASMEGRNLGEINIRDHGSTQHETITNDAEVGQGQVTGSNPGNEGYLYCLLKCY
uniref:Uncharacterized protein n=1 Tax=Meloidogyne enterolobii TaxID=390850 RepID=A0A6V7WM29_MELEN|nr:unnamed protein product [Meloidogyne enterolobii]